MPNVKIRKDGQEYDIGVIPQSLYDDVEDLKDGKVDKSGDTISGKLTIDRQNGTTSSIGYSQLELGNNIAEGTQNNSAGLLKIFGKNSYSGMMYDHDGLTNDREYYLPNKSGTLALTSDIPTITRITQNVSVTANDLVSTDLDFGDIDTNKILMVQVTWSNTISDVPTAIVYYAHNKPYINKVNHKWSATQTVTFYLSVLHT